MHEVSAFITLTYEGEIGPGLVYKDFQDFMKRVRFRLGPTRFFMCGEYGELGLRPHFHALLFGRTFYDGKQIGESLYRSSTLDALWQKGHASYGSVTYDSARYVAGYTCKKITGDPADAHYSRVDLRTGEIVRVPAEFGHMSLKPGIGYSWFQKYWREVYGPRDGVVLKGGITVPPPRYYDNLLLQLDSDLREYKDFERYLRSDKFKEDCTPERLLVREKCALAKQRFLKRTTL